MEEKLTGKPAPTASIYGFLLSLSVLFWADEL